MKEIAEHVLKHPVKRKPKTRISWLNYKNLSLNIKRKASVTRLKIKKKQMIDNGEIDVGKTIVPIEYQTVQVQSDGTLVG
ncbi:hypothetical protein EB796_016942 [Bugula neritina]|uniref:Uncharacterized protein n=1 Tax=Bugula neritina TaxID=10212 RepID=A0A7J7JEL8_BUGNE|nr:hypothetical protein EB796_016942 [Bugula neritina]